MAKIFDGLKVLDFSESLSGSFAAMLMCDMGAEVILVEPPSGSAQRHMEPLIEGENGKQSGYFISLSRGKKSMVLDIANPDSKGIIFKLTEWADVLIENFIPGTLKEFGLDYEVLKKINPKLVMCSVSMYGQEGPLAKCPPYDILAQAGSGLMGLTGDPDRYPQPEGTCIGEVSAATHALSGIAAALYYRNETGIGQHIDISIRDCLAAVLEAAIPWYCMKDVVITRKGSHHAALAPYGVFDAGRGRFVAIACISYPQWERFAKIMGREDLAYAEDYHLASDRFANFDTVKKVIEDYFKSFDDLNEPIALCVKNNVPIAPVLSIGQLLEDQQYLSRNNICEAEDPVFGKVKLASAPFVFSETEVLNTAPAPALGQHTEYVLKGLLGINSY